MKQLILSSLGVIILVGMPTFAAELSKSQSLPETAAKTNVQAVPKPSTVATSNSVKEVPKLMQNGAHSVRNKGEKSHKKI